MSAAAHSRRALATRIGQKFRVRGFSFWRTTSTACSIVSLGSLSAAMAPDAKKAAFAGSMT